MSLDRRMGLLSMTAMLVLGVLVFPRLVAPDSFLYREILTPRLVILVAAPLKLLFLVLAAIYASRSGSSFEKANPVRSAWFLLAAGLWSYVAAQSVLAVYQLVLNQPAPFPSVADLFFLPATVLLAVSLFSFLSVYKRVGFEVADTFEVGIVAACTLSLLAVFYVVVGRPVLASDAPFAERALNIAYPVLDCVLLIPAVLLLRMALSMRGGSLWRVWMALLLGFVFLAVGDILFAFFTSLGKSSLDPLLDLAFAWSYILIAWAVATQYGIVTRQEI
ncbi:MAG: hypothetical protein ACRD21_16145 [Vicinamibacteria bacterium]